MRFYHFVINCMFAVSLIGEEIPPWDLETLNKPPEFEWNETTGKIRSLVYKSLPYGDHKQTSVFALYATPGTLSGDTTKDKNLPAVVLVHGGGGTVFHEWVELWAKRGYAAIAMDLAGIGADKKRLPDGGPDQGGKEKFNAIGGPLNEIWSTHAVANVILAHSLICSFKEIDADRTAVTGISWGGYLTCIVAGLDHRFKAAVPVYGCGFLHHGSAWNRQFEMMTPELRAKWVRLFDPSNYVGKAKMPLFFVNGTNDFAYWMEQYHKTYSLVKNRNLRITVRMPHGHQPGWAPAEIGMFIDQHLLRATALPEVQLKEGNGVAADVKTETEIVGAWLNYTTETKPNQQREWKTKEAIYEDGSVKVGELPEGSLIWFVTVKDKRGATVSSDLGFAK